MAQRGACPRGDEGRQAGRWIDTGLRAITFHKNQYGPASATCFVRYEGGLFLPVEGMSVDGAAQAAKAEEVFIALLKRFTAQHQMVSPKPSAAYAPSRFAEHPEAGGITGKEFGRRSSDCSMPKSSKSAPGGGLRGKLIISL
jgi:hypothetical protein